MRTSTKLITALSVAGLIGVAGSAFTAASSIDQSTKVVGATTQTITGVSVSAVQYTVDTADKTTGVAFHVTQDLAANPAVVKAKLSNGTVLEDEEVTCSGAAATPGTDLTCSFPTGVTGVTSLTITAS